MRILPRMLRIDQVADLMGVHQMTVRRWVEKGVLRGTKVGGVIRVHKASVEEAIDRGEVTQSKAK